MGNEEQAGLIRQAITKRGLDYLDDIIGIIESTGAIRYTMAKAEQEKNQAIDCLAQLSDTSYRQAMYNLAEFAVHRSY